MDTNPPTNAHSYQSTLPLFLPAADSAPSPETISTALGTMTAALPVAAKACATTTTTSSGKPRVALSLGPYGSALQPGQEYTGAYPPPFGPAQTAAKKARPASSPRAREACPLPLEQVRASYPPSTNGDEDEEREAEVHLAAWHLQRLQHFLRCSERQQDPPDAAAKVDVVAFETVPSLTEIRAIRKAMHIFSTSSGSGSGSANPLPFYISLVFPRTSDSDDAVRFPDPKLAHLPKLADQIPLLVEAALLPAPTPNNGSYAVPGGLGFNCTSPLHAQEVVRLLSDQVAKLQLQQQQEQLQDQDKPWLLVYPDGGAVYDVVSRSWHHPTGLTDSSWARLVVDAVSDAVPASASASPSPWAGVVVGGCCKAGPSAIKALRQEVEQRGWRR